MTVLNSQCYIGETKRALTLRIKEHQANCSNQNQHSAVVDHSATGHSWGFTRAKVINTESLFMNRARILMQNHIFFYVG